jgi:hypothetical protein
MLRRSRERGEGRFGCLFGLILLVAAIFVAYKLIPIKVKAAELRETVVDEGKAAGQHGDGTIKKAILRKAQDLQLPLGEEGLSISRANEYIKIDADYYVPVQFPGYVFQWHFHHHAENPIF